MVDFADLKPGVDDLKDWFEVEDRLDLDRNPLLVVSLTGRAFVVGKRNCASPVRALEETCARVGVDSGFDC